LVRACVFHSWGGRALLAASLRSAKSRRGHGILWLHVLATYVSPTSATGRFHTGTGRTLLLLRGYFMTLTWFACSTAEHISGPRFTTSYNAVPACSCSSTLFVLPTYKRHNIIFSFLNIDMSSTSFTYAVVAAPGRIWAQATCCITGSTTPYWRTVEHGSTATCLYTAVWLDSSGDRALNLYKTNVGYDLRNTFPSQHSFIWHLTGRCWRRAATMRGEGSYWRDCYNFAGGARCRKDAHTIRAQV
jgi:hypothetical protein